MAAAETLLKLPEQVLCVVGTFVSALVSMRDQYPIRRDVLSS